ncbi:MAG: flagellar type III secretion system pore protein FliP [Alphaproteobacteria bacterium]|nr:flagellar type III secretion system pore protein FliP [Alphaproteobacteria bacterium]
MRLRSRLAFALALVCAGLLAPGPAVAQTLSLDLGPDGSLTSQILQLIAVLTVVSLAPSILVMVTSFTRIVVVLSLLRTAIGIQQSPPNSVLISLALFLTAFIMTPVFKEAYADGIRPLLDKEITQEQAFDRTAAPIHGFMIHHVREKDLGLFLKMSGAPAPQTAEDTPLTALIPAFMISELRRAFEIGFLLFLPFLIIDLVIASVLMAMGMMMLPPIIVSLPFKLIFFVLVDGWFLVAGSLVESFAK